MFGKTKGAGSESFEDEEEKREVGESVKGNDEGTQRGIQSRSYEIRWGDSKARRLHSLCLWSSLVISSTPNAPYIPTPSIAFAY